MGGVSGAGVGVAGAVEEGAAGAGAVDGASAGFAGAVADGAVPSPVAGGAMGASAAGASFFFRSKTLVDKNRPFDSTDRLREVTIKMTAAETVSLLKNVPGPRLPKTVWLDPPKEAPISAPFPA